ncbi:MAG TPA: MauE/DoxX family redox-associated membrane protein [Acidimicrobiales bacterium]|nr:MauE/DoxX family redox-associated membrane protein [Acidimicrobiales bacterium]
MGAGLLASRLVLALVFLVAGAAKAFDFSGARQAVASFAVPPRLSGPVARAMPLAEVAVAVALVPVASAPYAAIGACLLLLGFIAAIGNAMAHGRAPECHCFGQVHSAPVGWNTLARNSVLLALAGFVAIAGRGDGGTSATHWLTKLSAPWLVAVAAGALVLGLVSFQVWFSLQLLAQNGRTLGRLEALEAAFADLAGRPLGASMPVTAPLGAGLAAGGLRVGSAAPGFSLTALDGEEHSLSSLLAAGRPLLLIFTDSGCGPCEALLPEVARWQRRYSRRLTIALVAGGDGQRSRDKAERHHLEPVLLQPGREVADAYRARGTPTAVVVGVDGLIASPVVGGAEAIATLVDQAARVVLPVEVARSENGHRNGHATPSVDDSGVGQRVPALSLTDLDGSDVALVEVVGERAVVLFWNPGCGFCQRMLPELKALELAPPPGAPKVLVLSAGDPEEARQQGLRSTVLVDTGSAAAHALGAGGTPMAVLVEGGRVASTVAAGAQAVFELVHAAAQQTQRAPEESPLER